MKAGKKAHSASIVKNRSPSNRGTAWRRRSTLVEVHARSPVDALESQIFKELPPLETRILDDFLEKKHVRRCLLTQENLVMARPERELVLDAVPLIEITEIAHVKVSEEQPADSMRRAESVGPEHENAFYINTHSEGLCAGRSYCLRASSKESCAEWVKELQTAVKTAVKTARQHELHQGLAVWRSWSRRVYKSFPFQTFVGMCILAAFSCAIARAEMRPDKDSDLDWAFAWAQTAFTIIFVLELGFNLFGHWMTKFCADHWNYFDIVVVLISVMAEFIPQAPALSLLRLIRIFRVVRIFRWLRSLRQIIDALLSACVPVLNSFVVLLIVTCIYAVLATELLQHRSDEFFGSFSSALFSMFQIATGDAWASQIGRQLLDEQGLLDAWAILFLVSYVLIVGLVLINIVIAVLLDEFLSTVEKEKAEHANEQHRRARQQMGIVKSPLDPLLESLCSFYTNDDLSQRIRDLFEMLDLDENKSLSCDELNYGLRGLKFKPPIHLTLDDYEVITEGHTLCNNLGELDAESFEQVIRCQLRQFVQMQATAAMISADPVERSILYVAKQIALHMEDGRGAGAEIEILEDQGPSSAGSSLHKSRSGRSGRSGWSQWQDSGRALYKRDWQSEPHLEFNASAPILVSHRRLSKIMRTGSAGSAPLSEASNPLPTPAGGGQGPRQRSESWRRQLRAHQEATQREEKGSSGDSEGEAEGEEEMVGSAGGGGGGAGESAGGLQWRRRVSQGGMGEGGRGGEKAWVPGERESRPEGVAEVLEEVRKVQTMLLEQGREHREQVAELRGAMLGLLRRGGEWGHEAHGGSMRQGRADAQGAPSERGRSPTGTSIKVVTPHGRRRSVSHISIAGDGTIQSAGLPVYMTDKPRRGSRSVSPEEDGRRRAPEPRRHDGPDAKSRPEGINPQGSVQELMGRANGTFPSHESSLRTNGVSPPNSGPLPLRAGADRRAAEGGKSAGSQRRIAIAAPDGLSLSQQAAPAQVAEGLVEAKGSGPGGIALQEEGARQAHVTALVDGVIASGTGVGPGPTRRGQADSGEGGREVGLFAANAMTHDAAAVSGVDLVVLGKEGGMDTTGTGRPKGIWNPENGAGVGAQP